MSPGDLKRRLAEAEAAVVDSTRAVRNQREDLAELIRRGHAAEAAQAQAALEILEDRLRRHVAERDILSRNRGAADVEDDED
jgi:hypothetical protein